MAIVRGRGHRVKVIVIVEGYGQLSNVNIALDDWHKPWPCQLRLSRNIKDIFLRTLHAHSSVLRYENKKQLHSVSTKRSPCIFVITQSKIN